MGKIVYGDSRYPLVSILVPVFNEEKYLANCLTSIISQTYKKIEIIIINDGSVDNSESILKKFSYSDSRIRYYTQENKGLSSARNKALSFARGKYVLNVDSDDWLEGNCVEKLVSAAEENGADIVICDVMKEYAYSKKHHYEPYLPVSNFTKFIDSFIFGNRYVSE